MDKKRKKNDKSTRKKRKTFPFFAILRGDSEDLLAQFGDHLEPRKFNKVIDPEKRIKDAPTFKGPFNKAMVIVVPKSQKDPYKDPITEDNADKCKQVNVIQHQEVQVNLYPNLRYNYHYVNDWESAVELSNKLQAEVSQCIYPNNQSHINDCDATPPISVLNSVTDEYNNSPFPNVRFDAEGIVKLLMAYEEYFMMRS